MNHPLSKELLDLINSNACKNQFTNLTSEEWANKIIHPTLPYTNWEYHCALSLVTNKKNWKRTISSDIAQADKVIVERAIMNATGSSSVFTEQPNGRLKVIADGYYNAIGA